MTHRSNETSVKKFDTYHKKSPKAPIREYTNIHNNVSRKRVFVIGDSMVKFVKSENLSDENYIANIRTNPDCTTEDTADYIKPIIRRKPDIILVRTGTNDLTNSVNKMSKVRKIVKAVEEMDGRNKIKLGFSSIIVRKDREGNRKGTTLFTKNIYKSFSSRF